MPHLEDFPTYKQKTDHSCWACAGRAISNWFVSKGKGGRNKTYESDQLFADAWAVVSSDRAYADIDVMQSASAALADLGYTNNTDEYPIASADDIKAEIEKGNPMLAIVGTSKPADGKANNEYKEGHWVVITGISENGSKLRVFDPDNGVEHEVDYSNEIYTEGVYWENTSYVDPIE